MFLLDICYDLSKYRGIHIRDEDSSIKFFHHYQKLVLDSRQSDSLDPYPIKYIGNMKSFVDAIGQMMKQMSSMFVQMNRRK